MRFVCDGTCLLEARDNTPKRDRLARKPGGPPRVQGRFLRFSQVQRAKIRSERGSKWLAARSVWRKRYRRRTVPGARVFRNRAPAGGVHGGPLDGLCPGYAVLEIEFISGRVYRYHMSAAARVDGFLAAASKGRYFDACIREKFPTTRMMWGAMLRKSGFVARRLCRARPLSGPCAWRIPRRGVPPFRRSWRPGRVRAADGPGRNWELSAP